MVAWDQAVSLGESIMWEELGVLVLTWKRIVSYGAVLNGVC